MFHAPPVSMPTIGCGLPQAVNKLRVLQLRAPVFLQCLDYNCLGIVVFGERAGRANDFHSLGVLFLDQAAAVCS